MGAKLTRGKQQVLFNYLPEDTFDFGKLGVLAKVIELSGIESKELNLNLVLQAIQHYTSAWSEELAPIFRPLSLDNFVLLEPRKVYADTFPKVFVCQEPTCRRIHDYTNRDELPNQKTCGSCQKGTLIQLRWIKVHRCGYMEELRPPYQCKKCKVFNQFGLIIRKSERVADFRWICKNCNHLSILYGGECRSCNWTAMTGKTDHSLRQMQIETHRAGPTYYPHYVHLLNKPGPEMNAFLGMDDWQLIAAASFLELPQVQGQNLMEFPKRQPQNTVISSDLSEDQIAQFQTEGYDDEKIENFRQMLASLTNTETNQEPEQTSKHIARTLIEQSGIAETIWREAGQEMLEAVLPIETGQTQELFSLQLSNQQTAKEIARNIGIERLTLTTDFPVTLAMFGFSRTSYKPTECRLNPFRADDDFDGKHPIFVDVVQADAVIIRLDANRVWKWLELNGFAPSFQGSPTNLDLAKRAYYVNLFNDVSLGLNLTSEEPERRMVFGLLHTMSHLFIRRASLLCGLERTSLAEYVLPRALTLALYCSHRQGATIGALASLFEQSLEEWLKQIYNDSRRCVYDPICFANHGGNCHACTHLSETSCRFFNMNLGRHFLFGGVDQELEKDLIGYFDPRLNNTTHSIQ